MIKTKGKKNQIEYQDKKYDVYFYIYKDGSGYVWQFENESSHKYFESTFFFKLDNLKIAPHNDPLNQGNEKDNEWKVNLGPGESSALHLIMVDLDKTWGYKYKYSFKCKNDKNLLIDKIKQSGTKKQMILNGKQVEVYYYIFIMSDKYYCHYENLSGETFKGTFKFDFANSKILEAPDKTFNDDGNAEDVDEHEAPPELSKRWKLLLKPGEACTKCIDKN